MARETLLTCDSCGKKQGGKVIVYAIEARRSDGTKWMVDLCGRCFEDCERRYNVRPLKRIPRNSFRVYDSVGDIPTNGA